MTSVYRYFRAFKSTFYFIISLIFIIFVFYTTNLGVSSKIMIIYNAHNGLTFTNLPFVKKPTIPISISNSLFKGNPSFQTTLKLNQYKKNTNDTFGGHLYCDNNLEVINSQIVHMKNVVVNVSLISKQQMGRENLTSVMGQSESKEKINVKPGFFRLPCKKLPKLGHKMKIHFNQWFSGIEDIDNNRSPLIDSVHKEDLDVFSNFVVLVKRGDYANLFFTFIDLYNTFITIKLFKQNPKNTTVILMDSHPMGKLDVLWKKIFGDVLRIGQITRSFKVDTLVWGLYTGPLSESIKNPPHLNDFKYLFLKEFGITHKSYERCPKSILEASVTFILRRNYIAHPRNPKGQIMRKISNEDELISGLKLTLNTTKIRFVQLDDFPLHKQIEIIADTDVLVGVHGAGLAYGFLLRSGTTMIELFPWKYKKRPNFHFKQVAEWTKLNYKNWFSPKKDSKLEWVFVPLEVITPLIRNSIQEINDKCKNVSQLTTKHSPLTK